ncbi:ATP-binding protein [Candidatus Pacearchaeota archaeon]|nr:ATP-binding protein [Candidatus Pacearchaeota archaeon]
MKKVVITGGPCSGKTTLINILSEKGYYVIGEIARKVLIERKNNELNKNEFSIRQTIMAERQIAKEKELETRKGKLVIFDRSLIDILAYCRYFDINPPKVIDNINLSKNYDFVFILDLLPFEKDEVRIENEEDVLTIHNLIYGIYKNLGYNIIQVPVMDIEKRINFIEDFLKKWG